MSKQGLGPVVIAGKKMPWGKGAVGNGFVFLSGLEGSVDDLGNRVAGVAEQTALALERGERYLIEAGSSMELAVRVVQYLARAEDSACFHRARDAWLAERAPHLLAEQSYGGLLLIQAFSDPGRLVELEVTAVLG